MKTVVKLWWDEDLSLNKWQIPRWIFSLLENVILHWRGAIDGWVEPSASAITGVGTGVGTCRSLAGSDLPRLVSRHSLRFLFELQGLGTFRCDLPPQFCFQRRQLLLDFFSCFAFPDNLLAVAPQEVIDGLDANPD